jgi:hypothetical protein
MPQACRIGVPSCSRYASDSAFGTAEPPHGIARRLDVSRPRNSGNTAIQIVGTPAERVTLCSTIVSAIPCGVMFGPGNTCRAPDRHAA